MKALLYLLIALGPAASVLRADSKSAPEPIAQTGLRLVSEMKQLIQKKDLESLRDAKIIGLAYLVLEKEYPKDLVSIATTMTGLDDEIQQSELKQLTEPSTGGSGGGSITVDEVLQTFTTLSQLTPQARETMMQTLAPDLKTAVEQYQKAYPQLMQSPASNPAAAPQLLDALTQASGDPKTLQATLDKLPAQDKAVLKDAAQQLKVDQ